MLVTADPPALLTPQGRELLARLAAASPAGLTGSPLAQAERLRREYPAGLVALAMAQHELRLAAVAKFSRAAEMLFTRAGYEQSSSEAIAGYRAARLGDAGLGGAGRVADLCCGTAEMSNAGTRRPRAAAGDEARAPGNITPRTSLPSPDSKAPASQPKAMIMKGCWCSHAVKPSRHHNPP